MKTRFLFIIFFLALLISVDFSAKGQSSANLKYGEDSVACITNISLYREFYRQWKDSKYKSAVIKDVIAPWKKVLQNCPRATQNTYVDGVKIMSYLIDKEQDKAKREKFIDSLMMLYDNRIKYFGKEGFILGRKGVDYYKYRTANFEEAYKIFKQSVDLEKNKSEGPILIYYFRTTVKMVKEGLAEKSLIVEAYEKISNIIDYNIKKNSEKAGNLENWQNVKGNIEAEFEPFATCDDLLAIYSVKFEKNPNDIELLKKITSILDKKKCVETRLYFDATLKLYTLDPSPESAYLIAKMYLKEENYKKALEFLSKATKIENAYDAADIYYYMALCNQRMDNFPEARKNAYKSLEYNGENGNAYILIGDLYAASAKNCGDNDLTKKVAFWAAVDKYQKAKNIDASVADIANKRIKDYSAHFPSTETIFFYNYKEGDTYKVECWINEETKIRAAE